AYNLTFLTLISGRLDVERLRIALDSVVDSTDIFKMDFLEEAGTAYCRIDRRRRSPVTVVHRPEGVSEQEFIREIHSLAWNLQNSAPAQQWPVHSISIHVVSETLAYLLTCAPHLLIDGIGYSSWLEAVSGSYNTGLPRTKDGANTTSGRSEEKCSRTSKLDARTTEYFAREVLGLESLEAPAIVQRRDSTGGIRGRVVSFEIPRNAIDPVLAAKKLLPSQFFFSVYALLLRRLIPMERIVFGYAVPNRTQETKSDIACFVNTVPVVLDIPLHTTSSNMMKAIAKKLFRLHRYQGYDPDAFPNLAPRMTCLFTFYESEFNYAFDGCISTSLPVARIHLPAEIRLTVEMRSETYRPVFDLGTYFDEIDVEKEFRLLMEKVILEPDVPLSDIPLSESRLWGGELDPVLCGKTPGIYAPAAREASLLCFRISNGHKGSGLTNKNAAVSLSRELEAIAAKNPHRPAVSCAGKVWTYEELNANSNRIALCLLAEAGDCRNIVVSVERCKAAIATILAILKIGKCYVPVDPRLPTERCRHILHELESPFVISDRDVSASTQGMTLGELLSRSAIFPSNNLDAGNQAEDAAYLIYTSGSTGLPKGVSISHRNLLSLIRACDQEFDFGPNDVWTLFHSLSFDYSIWEAFGCLLHGGKLVIVDSVTTQAPDRLYELLCREKVTIMNHTPSVFKTLIREDQLRAGTLTPRYVFLGGEALQFSMLRDWVVRHPLSECKIVNLYGPTEVTILATTYKLCDEDLAQERSVVGKPIAGSWIDIRMPDGALAVPGVVGEIVISGAGVTKGYYKRDHDTETKFMFRPDGAAFRTGDLGRVRNDGNIEFLGRIDRQVKVRGFRVELAEIESALRKAGMADCALDLVTFDGDNDIRLVAYVLPGKKGFNERELRDVLKGTLPAYMIPSVFVEISRIPVTIGGKVDFAELAKFVSSRPSNAKGHTDTERWLFSLVASKLKHDKFDVTDNLLDIGLASLDIVDLVTSIRGVRTCELSVLEVFEYPTIQALGEHLDSRETPALKGEKEEDERAGKRQGMLALRTTSRAASAVGSNQ
ncbi:MAG: hypothetical protein C5B54_12340, partial [Acidobacteria bacterium]